MSDQSSTDFASHPNLPKASLLHFEFDWWWFKYGRRYRRLIMKNRFANAFGLGLGPFYFVWRRPWLTGPAHQLHPELFK